MAQSLNSKESTNDFGGLRFYLADLYIGAVLLALGLVRYNYGSRGLGIIMVGLGLILLIISMIIFYIRLFQIWRFIINTSPSAGLKPSVETPARAVGYLFIPLFNLYWIFLAVGRLPRDLNALAKYLGIPGRVYSGIGLAIAIITIISMIPFIGGVTGAANGLMLIPIFLSSSIRLCREAKEKISASGGSDVAAPVLPEMPETRNFLELFNNSRSGFRWGVLIAFIVSYIFSLLAIILAMFPGIVVLNGPFFQFLLGQTFMGALAGILFIIVCSYVKKIWLLPAMWGLLSILLAICDMCLSRLINLEGPIRMFLHIYPDFHISANMLTSNFLWGFAFMASLILAVRFWGMRAWSLATGLMAICLIFNIRQWSYYLFHLDPLRTFFLVLPIVQYGVLGLLLYFALRSPVLRPE